MVTLRLSMEPPMRPEITSDPEKLVELARELGLFSDEVTEMDEVRTVLNYSKTLKKHEKLQEETGNEQGRSS